MAIKFMSCAWSLSIDLIDLRQIPYSILCKGKICFKIAVRNLVGGFMSNFKNEIAS